MAKIKQLSPHEAQKIAAGEVVERPSNIVKELVENSIDAGATQISVYLKDGGKELIRVVDNGCGMDAVDARICFAKHATSKITCVDDLQSINTFGFRGEALATIAAVARVTLITKEAGALEGIKITIACNEVISQEVVPANTGTEISVHDIFSAIPARKKFLKSRETEWRHSVQLMHAFCFAYPTIHFKLFSEGKEIINCGSVENVTQRVAHVWSELRMLSIDAQHDEKKVSISGVVSNHQQYRYDRNNIFLFVNNRWVQDFKLANAVIKGYKNVIPHGQFPSAVIAITVDPTLVDVNIHPRKQEVRFMHPRMVETLIQDTVRSALEQNISAYVGKTVTMHQPVDFFDARSFAMAPARTFTPYDFSSVDSLPEFLPHQVVEKNQHAPQVPLVTSSVISDSTYNVPSREHDAQQHELYTEYEPHIIGVLKNTYIMLEQAEGLFLVDQHAAHERVLYELFAHRFHDVATVNLIFPEIIPLSAQDFAIVEPWLSLFTAHGIELEPFGNNQLIVHATPVHLKNSSCAELVRQVIGWIHEHQQVNQEDFVKKINEKLHAQMACKAAVKAGDQLSMEQMVQLLKDLNSCNNRFTCPHGRPTGWLLSQYEIEKKFKRIT
jgi:DNA mismatch repair protein MutL